MRVLPSRWPWLALTLAALLIALVPTPLLEAGQRLWAATPPASASRYWQIEASSFAFAPAELRANPGDTITLELVATDYVHGLYVDGYALAVEAEPGQAARLTFVADRTGSFRFRCSVTCGPLHPFMIGKLYVGPNWTLLRGSALAVLAAVAGLWLVRP